MKVCFLGNRIGVAGSGMWVKNWKLRIEDQRLKSREENFTVCCFRFQDWGFEFWLPVSGFRVSGFGVRTSNVVCWVSGIGFRAAGSRFQVLGFGFWVLG